jgi:hypothetical protein
LRSGSGALVRRAFILRGLRLPARAHAKARRAGARVHAGEPSRFGVLCTAVQCHERDTPSVARENDTRRAPA